jgi:dihydroflavonol-4-reductase
LVTDGLEVRALARTDEAVGRVEALGAKAVRGDVLDPASLASGARGCAVAFHAAGVNAACAPDPTEMLHVNVGGSANVVRACAETGVGRLVVTSSAAALGEPRGTIGRETSPHRGWFLSNYERSKFLAERAAFDEARGTDLDVVAVNPSSVQGPGRTTGTARLLALAFGRVVPIVRATVSIVDVDDCVEGHVLAAERGRPGERYVLCGATLTTRELVDALERATGEPRRVLVLPRALVSITGALGRIGSRVMRRETAWCPELARVLLHGHAYDGSRAERELGLRYAPIEDTLRRTLAWQLERRLAAKAGGGRRRMSPFRPTSGRSPKERA